MTEPLYNPPSIDPAQRDTLMGTIQFIIDKLVMQEIDKNMPCEVIAVDRASNRVSVQILVSFINTSGELQKRAQIASAPIYQPSGGGYVVSLPVAAGDYGWIKATDTDISMFLQTLRQSPPNTLLTHDFASSVFYPDNMNQGVTIANEDAGNLVIQTYDSTTRISVGPDTVKITAPTSITLDAPLTIITGLLESGTAAGGDATFGGKITATGDIKTNADGGISLGTHKHSGVEPGPGNTGGPIP